MGIIVKVYIENNDQEIDIVTLNSDDQKSSSVTITANSIKEYLHKLGRSEGYRGESKSISDCRNNEVDEEPHLSSNVNQLKSSKCSHSAIHETLPDVEPFTPDNVADSADSNLENTDSVDISHSSNLNIQLDDSRNGHNGSDVQNFVQVIEDTVRLNRGVDEQSSLNITATENLNTTVNAVGGASVIEGVDTLVNCTNNELLNFTLVGADSDTPIDNEGINPLISNDSISDFNNESIVTEINDTICNNSIVVEAASNRDIVSLRNEGEVILENFSNIEVAMPSENGVENVMESLKNVSYDVDDFLNMVNNTPKQFNPINNHSRVPSFPFIFSDFGNSPTLYSDERSEYDGDLEEFFVIEKIAASRYNEETKVFEFLLKAQKCVPRKEPWSPVTDTNINNLSITNPKCLYIQCPKNLRCYKRRKLNEKFELPVDFVDSEKGFTFDVHSEMLSSCSTVGDIPPIIEFSSLNAADVIIDPQKSLNDACLTESYVDDNKNITPIKLLKSGEDVSCMSDIGLPSAHFFITDIVPGLGEQLVDFVDTKDPSSATVNATTFNVKTTKKSSKRPSSTSNMPSSPSSTSKLPLSSSNPIRKRHRIANKNFKCPQCAYRTDRSVALDNHMRRHTNDMLKCGWCHKRYVSSAGLKNHERMHRKAESMALAAAALGLVTPPDADNSSSANTSLPAAQRMPSVPTNDAANTEFDATASVDDDVKVLSDFTQPPALLLNGALASSSSSSTGGALDLSINGVCDRKCQAKAASKSRLRNPRGRPKRTKVELTSGDAMRVGNDNNNHDTVVVVDAAAVAGGASTCAVAPSPKTRKQSVEQDLQKCLADTVDAIAGTDLVERSEDASIFDSQVRADQNVEEVCDVCHRSFTKQHDLFLHTEKVHKYPIVLIKRLPF